MRICIARKAQGRGAANADIKQLGSIQSLGLPRHMSHGPVRLFSPAQPPKCRISRARPRRRRRNRAPSPSPWRPPPPRSSPAPAFPSSAQHPFSASSPLPRARGARRRGRSPRAAAREPARTRIARRWSLRPPWSAAPRRAARRSSSSSRRWRPRPGAPVGRGPRRRSCGSGRPTRTPSSSPGWASASSSSSRASRSPPLVIYTVVIWSQTYNAAFALLIGEW